MINSFFVDKNINVFYDKKAQDLISNKNDKEFLVDGEITKVPISRWNEAQFYEEKTWMLNGIQENDDRNYEHLERFENYDIVPFSNIRSFIELGCGPFTNTRLIIDKFSDNCDIHLLDPLIDKYKNHPNCFYKNSKYKNKTLNTINCSIESLNINIKYDCVLINNVLEHCYDINLIFKKIIDILNKNGILIFSDVCFSKSSIEELVEKTYDAGHPIRVSKNSIDLFLQNFISLYNKEYHGLYNQSWRMDKYFIGKKL